MEADQQICGGRSIRDITATFALGSVQTLGRLLVVQGPMSAERTFWLDVPRGVVLEATGRQLADAPINLI